MVGRPLWSETNDMVVTSSSETLHILNNFDIHMGNKACIPAV